MPLTPADIHNVEFRKPPLGQRGYDDIAVNDFLDLVAEELTRLTAENRALRERRTGSEHPQPESGQRRSEPGQRQPGLAGRPTLAGQPAALAAKLKRLKSEQAHVEQQVRDLRAELERARAAQQPAAVNDDPVVALAQRTADEHLREADERARTILATARTEADRLTSDAALRAATIDSDARHRHTEAVNSLAGRRATALAEIDRLTRIAQAHRDRIRLHADKRLQDLNGA